jgi:hypothetical protein
MSRLEDIRRQAVGYDGDQVILTEADFTWLLSRAENEGRGGAEEVMQRVYDLLMEAAGELTPRHPAAEFVGQAIDFLAGWLGKRTVIIGQEPNHPVTP